MTHPIRPAAAALALAGSLFAALPLPAQAQTGEAYAAIGLPGLVLGYAQPLSSTLTLRADIATLGSRSKQQEEEGINYRGTAKLLRVGVFADWFVAGGGFRLTGGLASTDASLRLLAQGDGTPIEIGDTSYPTTPDDSLDVRVKYPSVMPYLGVGYGHQAGDKGLGFVFDLGVSIGKPKVSAKGRGPNLGAVNAADLDAELQELRDGVAKVKVLPQVSVGLSYRF